MADNFSNPTPQFGTAEYAGLRGTEHCSFCKQPIGRSYYRVNTAMACPTCGERAQHQLPADSHSGFTRSLIFGLGGAALGLVIYAVFAITTGLVIGYVSLAVGYIVGKAIKLGSLGAGGRRYQIAAVVLTYAAVSLAAIPIDISIYAKQRKAQQAAQVTQSDNHAQPPAEPTPARHAGVAGAIVQLAFIGLASPFLDLASDPFHGLIGLVILFVGLKIAWQITAGSELQITGPFENAVPAT
ncbi:MAG TPA: hypothetical protein VIG91_08960 [Terriglobales bacterium]